MSTEDYLKKTAALLEDATYKKVPVDPTYKKSKMIKDLLGDMHKSGAMSKPLFKQLCPHYPTAPRLYALPKVHKPGVPMRPIACMVDSPVSNLSTYLTKVIGPVLGNSEFTVSNSKEFVEQLKSLDVPPSSKMVSFDVVSLFTKVPVKDAVDVVCDKLNADTTLPDRTELPVATIRRLIEACLECRYFSFNNEFYIQLEGAPMGLSLSVVLANAYMEALEEKHLASSVLKPSVWRRYVDDTWVLWPHGDEALADFFSDMNSIHPDIEFTMETETDGQLPFLDVLVTRNQTGSLDTGVYRKPITSDSYIHESSNHAPSIKRGIITNMFRRAADICSSDASRKAENSKLVDIFEKNGYKKSFISKAQPNTTAGARAVDPSSNQLSYVSMPYVKGVSEPIARLMRKHNVVVAHSSKKIKGMLMNVKDQIPPEKKKNKVYHFSCDCGESYIGETGRPLDVRMSEHVADIKHCRLKKSGPARHFYTCKKNLDPKKATAVASEQSWRKRTIREAIEIRERDPKMNQDVGKYKLSPIWDLVLGSD